jgi:steroid 5-alpha reductase family enzyme
MIEYLFLIIILFIYINFWFMLSVITKRNDIADIAWGLGFVLIAWTSYFAQQNMNSVALLVNVLVTVWGLRLSIHIAKRLIVKTEDYRYAIWRKKWKYFYLRSYFQVFILQGFLMFIIALPIILINVSSNFGQSILAYFRTMYLAVGALL